MKLAEALIKRPNLKKKIDNLSARLANSSIVAEGYKPDEDFESLSKMMEVCLKEYEKLILSINITNMKTIVDGISLTRMMVERSNLIKRLVILRKVIKTAIAQKEGIENYIRTVNVKDLHKEADGYAKQLRILDAKIQETNWQTELI
jgi:hypothetical protein